MRPLLTVVGIQRSAGLQERKRSTEWTDAIDLADLSLSLDQIAL